VETHSTPSQQDEAYAAAMQDYLSRPAKPLKDSQESYPSREELYDRGKYHGQSLVVALLIAAERENGLNCLLNLFGSPFEHFLDRQTNIHYFINNLGDIHIKVFIAL